MFKTVFNWHMRLEGVRADLPALWSMTTATARRAPEGDPILRAWLMSLLPKGSPMPLCSIPRSIVFFDWS